MDHHFRALREERYSFRGITLCETNNFKFKYIYLHIYEYQEIEDNIAT